MKYVFASLLCHRDVQIFKFNWFCMRMHIDHGFNIQHLILNDGSLTDGDITELQLLPNVVIDSVPITRYPNVPKDILLGKLQCLKRGFDIFNADRVVVFDCDIFFMKSWDADLRTILTNRAVVLRDWGSSLGPNVEKYKELFGVHEDETTPNCNTGVISVEKKDWFLIEKNLQKHFDNPFMIMEDQGIMVASFHGQLTYAEGIKCIISGAENVKVLWDWTLNQRAAHLMGMRTRLPGLKSLIQTSLNQLPKTLHLSQIDPIDKFSSWGLMEYGHYNFTVPLQKLPSTSDGHYITDALYMHGGSYAQWKLPPRITEFTARVVCMDTGIKENVISVFVNGQVCPLGSEIKIPLMGHLQIQTHHGPGTHIAFLAPTLYIDTLSWPDLSHQTS